MKRMYLILSITFVFVFSNLQTILAQEVLEGVGIDLISEEAPGWFNQVRFWKGTEKLRHVITDHGDRGRLIIYPGFGGGAKNEVEISGKVAFGTTEMPDELGDRDLSQYHIFAKGGILTEELLVRTGWADYVFNEDYSLMSIPDLKNFIQEENHLPNLPSEADVLKNGLELSSITVLQQEKIEEAFLYIIQLEERIQALEKKLTKVENAEKQTTK